MAIICPSRLTYSRQRPITASHSSRYDMLAIISSRYQHGPFLFFVAGVMSNYLTTDGLKKISLLPEAPLRPEAFATSATWLIRHCSAPSDAARCGFAAVGAAARIYRSIAARPAGRRSAALQPRGVQQHMRAVPRRQLT